MGKRFLLISGYLLMAAGCFSQQQVADGFTRFFYGNGQVSSEGMIRDGKPDGKWTTYHVNGVVKSEGLRLNFQLDSTWNFYDESGQLTEQVNYKYGKKNGYHIHYQKNRNDSLAPMIRSKELYLDHIRQGLSYYYNESGALERVVRYKDGKRHGLTREMLNDTLIRAVFTFHNDYMIDREVINQTDPRGFRQGVWRDYHDNDNIRYEANYKDGELNGYYREYSSTGRVLVSAFYISGKLIEQDPEKEVRVEVINRFDDEGNIIASGGFMNSIPVGIHRETDSESGKIKLKEYNNSGQVLSEGKATTDGTKEEFWQFFYPGGIVQSEGNFRTDRRSGPWKFYYPDGKIEQEGYYADGREDGLWTWYYPSGEVRREENYYRGREDGLSVEYDQSGAEITRGEYLDGYREGEWYYHVGDHTEKGGYRGGMKDGVWKHYYLDGTLSFEGGYLQDMPNGKHRLYHENGKLKEEQYYNLGRKERTWWKFDAEGNPLISYTYENDVLVKIDGVKVNLEGGW